MKKGMFCSIIGKGWAIPFIREYNNDTDRPLVSKPTNEQLIKRLMAETENQKTKRSYNLFQLACRADGEFMEDLRE